LAAIYAKHGADPAATMYGAQGKRNSFDLEIMLFHSLQ